jgi:hypothetical protein
MPRKTRIHHRRFEKICRRWRRREQSQHSPHHYGNANQR